MSTVNRIGIKEGDLFAIMNPRGDIYPSEVSPEQGLYRDDTRFLSRLELRIEGVLPRLLSSTVKRDNLLFRADLTNPPIYNGDVRIPRDTIHLSRERFLWHDTCYERIRVRNYNHSPVELTLSLYLDADYRDIFEIRGKRREKRGELLPVEIREDEIMFSYRGLDGVTRYTEVKFNPPPSGFSAPDKPEGEPSGAQVVNYRIKLPPEGQKELILSIVATYEKDPQIQSYDEAFGLVKAKTESVRANTVDIFTSNEHFNEFLERSKSDICTLVTETPYGLYPYAGIPWYCTAFGRDGIITALECLWVAPEVAKGVLRFLAAHQSKELNDEDDAEPGKIPHEIRKGEMARTKEVPFAHYYGSVDATPLYIILAGEYLKRTGDTETIMEIWPNIKAALEWIIRYGDLDGDGFVEYLRRSSTGLKNQGWKDSAEAVFHADGSLAEPPIALVEVQGYVYMAFSEAQRLAKLMGETLLALELQRRMKSLRVKFQRTFWSSRLGCYVLALDGNKRPCEVRSSNAGHTLFTGIANKVSARRLAKLLLSDDFFSGWGIRTIARSERNYNPMSYHNGSVWPHDNALIGWGLSRYGFKREVLKIFTGLFEASQFVDLRRLPELFCGFERREAEGPTLYPVACQPQAWASGAVFLLLKAVLGLNFESETNSVVFKNPVLPEYLDVVVLNNITMAEGRVNLYLERYGEDVVVKVLEKEGDINIVIYK